MLDCSKAAKLPMIMVASAEAQTIPSHCSLTGSKAVRNTRNNPAKAAALGPAERKAATGAGAP